MVHKKWPVMTILCRILDYVDENLSEYHLAAGMTKLLLIKKLNVKVTCQTMKKVMRY
jgi:hypothetical protein